MQSPKVRAVAVNWNSGTRLGATIRSLAMQTAVQLEIVVVDNASSDDSLAQLPDDIHVRVVQAGANLGYAGGNNLGMTDLGDTEWVLIVNPDVAITEADTVARLAELGETRPDAGVIAPTIVLENGLIEYRGSQVDLNMALVTHTGVLCERWPEDTPEIVPVSWVDGAAMLIRRACLDAVGPFEDRYFLFHEEVDWCLRAHERGWLTVLARDVSVGHQRSSSFGTSTKGAYYYWRSMYLLCAARAAGWRWRFAWAGRLLRFALRRRNLRTGRSVRALHAGWDALRLVGGPLPEDR